MDFDYTVSTGKTFEQALKDLETNLLDAKFGLLWTMDVPSKLQEKGVDFDQPYRILEVCNPQKAKVALETDPRMGYFLPCKLVVYTKDGQTEIGMARPSVWADIVANPGLKEFAADVERTLRDVLDKTC